MTAAKSHPSPVAIWVTSVHHDRWVRCRGVGQRRTRSATSGRRAGGAERRLSRVGRGGPESLPDASTGPPGALRHGDRRPPAPGAPAASRSWVSECAPVARRAIPPVPGRRHDRQRPVTPGPTRLLRGDGRIDLYGSCLRTEQRWLSQDLQLLLLTGQLATQFSDRALVITRSRFRRAGVDTVLPHPARHRRRRDVVLTGEITKRPPALAIQPRFAP